MKQEQIHKEQQEPITTETQDKHKKDESQHKSTKQRRRQNTNNE